MNLPRSMRWLSAVLTVVAATATAQTVSLPTAPDAVEEDWVLVVGTPDPQGVGPQITTAMSPVSDNSTPFVAFDIDYVEFPSFSPGGMQLQVWSGETVLATASQGNALFNTPGETVSWTQRMSLSGGNVNYTINNGASVTWGNFGQGATLTVSYPSSLTSLSGYSPTVSATKSGVSWEENLVTSLTLKQIRYYANGQLIATDTTPRVLVNNTTN